MELCFYWINLDKDKARRANIEKEFRENNIKNVRIEAILGGETKESRELACTQSHVKALKTFLETKDEYAIICEDDMSFDYKKYWTKSIDKVISSAPADWEIIQLGFIASKIGSEFHKSKSDYLPHLRHYWSTISYVINRSGAKKIVKFKLDTKKRDLFVADCIIYSLVKSYTYKYPMFTSMDNNFSSIHSVRDEYHARSKKIIEEYLIKVTNKINTNQSSTKAVTGK